ncbi:uncharacterized protein LOC112190935 [Rosa chinensis]|uniref:uncharacterized protein LOC112190935 n=1 Tax=Rosa chinensis TaxID=74649 RepID=UPI000D09673B|nr:uncharacterized protein LOC112190935 [Rosa chinensis]
MELKHTRIASTVLILLCILVYTFAFTVRDGEEREREEVRIAKPSLWEIFKNGFSVYTSSPLKVTSYWEKVKSLVRQLHAYFFPPNLDFRGTSSSEEARIDQPSSPRIGGDGGGGAGEKVKEAVSKSFGKSKATVEDTAKSAAKAVGETVQKTKEKVKRSFSNREAGHQTHEPEL